MLPQSSGIGFMFSPFMFLGFALVVILFFFFKDSIDLSSITKGSDDPVSEDPDGDDAVDSGGPRRIETDDLDWFNPDEIYGPKPSDS